MAASIASSATFAASATLEEITVTATRVASSIHDVPASIDVIASEDIAELSPNTLSDLLRYQPGVTVENSGGRHGDANINIRGIGGNRILMVKDGTIMPDGFGSSGVSQGRGTFDPFSLQQVEILKGPASALYGSNALGGVVVIKTANPKQLVDSNDGELYASLNVGHFTEDERTRIGGSVATKVGSGYLLAQGQHQEYSERDLNSDFTANPKDGSTDSLLVKWYIEPASNQTLEVIADYFSDSSSHQLNTNIGPISGPPGTAVTEASAEDDSSMWRLSLQHKIEDLAFADAIKWQLDYQYSNFEQYELERVQNAGSVFPPIGASDTLAEEWEEFEQKQFTASVLVEKKLGKHGLLVGAEYITKSVERPLDRLDHDLINGTSTNVINGYVHPGKTFPDADITQVGLFVQDHLALTDSLKIVGGIRFDHFSNDPKPDEAYNNFNVSNAMPEKYSDDAVSPHVGLIWQLAQGTDLFANYTTGFRSPPVAEQYISRAILIPVPGVPHEVIPNNDLASEESEGFEFGVRWYSDIANASMSVYQNDYTDFIDSKTIGYREMPPVFTGPTAIRQIQYQNVDSVRIEGVELSANLTLDSWLPSQWGGELQGGISFIDGENRLEGTGLNSVPSDNGFVGLSLSPSSKLHLSWYVRAASAATGAEPLSFHGQPLPSFEPPGYSIHDVTVRYMPTANLSVLVSGYNLTDKKYWGAHTKGDNAMGNLDATVSPGRTFAVSASY